MESLTKPVLSEQQLAAIATKHLGEIAVQAVELTDGWFNAAFMLTLPDGREYVLKVAPLPDRKVLRYEANILATEVESMRMVSQVTNLPLPRIVAYDLEKAEIGSEYFMMNKLPGIPFNHAREAMTEDERANIYRQIGAHLRSLHNITSPSFGLYKGARFGTWKEAFMAMLEDLRQDGLEMDVLLPEGAFEAAEPLFTSLDHVRTSRLVHWDLWEGNVFVHDHVVTGLIDFERCLWGDPLIEINFWNRPPGTIEGYGSDPMAEEGAVQRRTLYDLYFYLVMIIESKYRGYTEEHEAWPRKQLDELLAKMRS